MRRKLSALLFAAIWLVGSPGLSWGWGIEGHEIVAQIAQDRLGVTAQREVRRLLGGDSIADVANWADVYRRTHKETGHWHFVDIRVNDDGTAAAFDPRKECVDHNCVIDKIADFTRIVGDKSVSKDNRTEALKFLIHFVGDIHQPLHCADRRYGRDMSDEGGNLVKVRYPSIPAPLSLHGVWDSTIIEQELLTGGKATDYANKIARDLDTPRGKEAISQWRQATRPVDWAIESNRLAIQYAYRGIPIEPRGTKVLNLSRDYVQNATPVVREQLAKAGVRLADILNELFPG